MEMVLLVAFVLIWLLVRSRDRKRQAQLDAQQQDFLRTLDSRVRALETAPARAAAAAEKNSTVASVATVATTATVGRHVGCSCGSGERAP